MPITVVTWGTGNVGRYAVRAVLNHPKLQLIGHIVSSEAKAGKDVAELAGLDKPTGIIASQKIDDVLALKPDCVCYTAHSANSCTLSIFSTFVRAFTFCYFCPFFC